MMSKCCPDDVHMMLKHCPVKLLFTVYIYNSLLPLLFSTVLSGTISPYPPLILIFIFERIYRYVRLCVCVWRTDDISSIVGYLLHQHFNVIFFFKNLRYHTLQSGMGRSPAPCFDPPLRSGVQIIQELSFLCRDERLPR